VFLGLNRALIKIDACQLVSIDACMPAAVKGGACVGMEAEGREPRVYVRVGAAGWRCQMLDKHQTAGKVNWIKIGRLEKKGDVEAREVSFS
jgi:hypothetical protein